MNEMRMPRWMCGVTTKDRSERTCEKMSKISNSDKDHREDESGTDMSREGTKGMY